jgi:hypothetical protein
MLQRGALFRKLLESRFFSSVSKNFTEHDEKSRVLKPKSKACVVKRFARGIISFNSKKKFGVDNTRISLFGTSPEGFQNDKKH